MEKIVPLLNVPQDEVSISKFQRNSSALTRLLALSPAKGDKNHPLHTF